MTRLLSPAELEALLAAVRLDPRPDASPPVTVSVGPGSIVALAPSPGGEVELFLDNRPIARGAVVVSDGRLALRVTSTAAPWDGGAGASSSAADSP